MLQTTSDFRDCLTLIFKTGWDLCKAFNIPGTNMNIIEFSIASLVLLFVFRRVLPLIGVKVDDSATAPGDLEPGGKYVNSDGMLRGSVRRK